jgi:broad specificity phosphatase PhoE
VLVHVVTHPEVRVEPDVPVPEWGLSEAGRDRPAHLLPLPWVPRLTRVVPSGEREALETAQALAAAAGLPVEVDPELGENDRSATGFLHRLPAAGGVRGAGRRVLRPSGRERAGRGTRGRRAAADRRRGRPRGGRRGRRRGAGPPGGVGTLLLCALLGVPIDRRHDRPGQGSVFSYDPCTGRGAHPWVRLGPAGCTGPATVSP